jgi:hypothetical protein
MTSPPNACNTPRELSTLGRPLPRFGEALRRSNSATIVVIGSCSTEGDGAKSKDAS